MRHLLPLLLAALWLIPIPQAHAQTPPALAVTLREATGRGVSGATVLVRDRGGQQLLARAQTDAAGRATFAQLPVAEVRVAIQGVPGGASLSQTGDDALGIMIFLDAPSVAVDLRVADGGRVVADPAMFAVEQSPAAPPVPTALLAASSMPAPRLAPTPTTPVSHAPISPASSTAAGDGGWLSGAAICLTILVAIGLVIASARGAV